MAIDDKPNRLTALERTLRLRYGHDYLVISEASPAAALGRLRELRAAGRPVALPLETSMPGVFTAGDVRHGSVKRVASAVGEGSVAATQMYQYLQDQTRNDRADAGLGHR
jgi:hypothetical protein